MKQSFVVEEGSNIPLQELRENQVEQSNLQVDAIEDIDADPELMPPSNRTSARLVVGKYGAQDDQNGNNDIGSYFMQYNGSHLNKDSGPEEMLFCVNSMKLSDSKSI